MAANFTATLHKSGEICFKDLALLEDEVMLALKAHLKLEKGFSLRDLGKVLLRYPYLGALDSRVASLSQQLALLPRAKSLGLALCYRQCLQLDSSEGPVEFGLSVELLAQESSSGNCLQVDASDLPAIIDLPLYFGQAEILHITTRNDYDAREAVSNVRVSLFDFIIGILDSLFLRQPEFGSVRSVTVEHAG